MQGSNVHLLLPLRTSSTNAPRGNHFCFGHFRNDTEFVYLRSGHCFRTYWSDKCMCSRLHFTTIMLHETQHAELEILRCCWLRRIWCCGHVYHGLRRRGENNQRKWDDEEMWLSKREKIQKKGTVRSCNNRWEHGIDICMGWCIFERYSERYVIHDREARFSRRMLILWQVEFVER